MLKGGVYEFIKSSISINGCKRRACGKRSKGDEGSSIDPSRLGIDMNTYYEMIQGINGVAAGTAFSGNFKV